MNFVIVIVGLGLTCAGAFLSWHQKKATVIWPTYAFGFLLVLTSSPISSGLSGLSVTGKGLDVKFSEISRTDAELGEIKGKAERSIKALSLVTNDVTSEAADRASVYTKDIVDKLTHLSAHWVTHQPKSLVRPTFVLAP